MDRAMPVRTVALCAAVQGVGGGLGWSLLPALMPQIAKDLHIDHTVGGAVWGAASLGIALAAPAGGALVDKLGPRRVAGIALFVGALACAARALATGPWTMALAMLAFGAHVGACAPAIPKMLGSHVAPHKLGRANGAALLAYTLGTALTVLVARPYLAPFAGGWRPLMVLAGGAMALVGVVWLALTRDRGARAPHAGIGELLAVARVGGLRRVAVIHFLLFGGYLALLGLLPRTLVERGMTPAQAGLAVAGWLVAAAVGNYAGPWISDRLGRRRPVIMVGALVAALGLAGVASGAVWMLVLAALGGGAFAPLLLAMPLEMPEIAAARAGGALGLLMLVGQAGGFLLPVLAGGAVQAGGFPVALGLLAAVHAVILVPALGLTETGPRGLRTAAPAFA